MDYSKTIDFFVETHRLCASRRDCKLSIDDRCPLYEFCEKAVPKLSRKDVEYAIETLHKWSRENPRKTYAQDFFEKFPEAKPDKEGVPRMCRANCYGGSCQAGVGPECPCFDPSGDFECIEYLMSQAAAALKEYSCNGGGEL